MPAKVEFHEIMLKGEKRRCATLKSQRTILKTIIFAVH